MLKIKYLILLTTLLTNTFLNAKFNEIKREISSITNLATTTTTAITAAENKTLNVNN